VPEGIIFQGQNAYKQLRKMLVENYLWAVVSLPAGVFNPYAGVKTSVLFLDRNLAKRTDEVLFVKVENDGFDLGAQRRPIAGSQLAEALKILAGHQKAQKEQEGKMALTITRKRLLESPEVNFSGDRYRVAAARPNVKWSMVKLGGLIRTINPPKKIQKSDFGKTGTYPIIDQSQQEIAGWTDDRPAIVLVYKPLVIFGDHTCSVKFTDRPFAQGADGIKILETDNSLSPRFLFFWLITFPIRAEGYKRHFSRLVETEIPLPPLDEQERIVAELEGYRKVIEGARQVLASYKPSIRIDLTWPVVSLGTVANVDGNLVDPKMPEYAALLHVSAENIEEGSGQLLPVQSAAEDRVTSGKYLFEPGCVLYSKLRPYLRKATVAGFKGLCSADMYPIRTDPARLTAEFLLWILLSAGFTTYANGLSHRARMPKLNRDQLLAYEIPLPPLPVQRRLVAELTAERKLVEANRELIARMEAKTNAKLAEVWGEDATETGGS